jgi:rare lipoprotein A
MRLFVAVVGAATVGTTVAASAHTVRHHDGSSGIASVYGGKFSGRPTAGGGRMRSAGLTAAHRSLPFGTLVRVTSDRTSRSVIVQINDRGPFVSGRIIDLSPAAARAIGMGDLAHVTLAVVDR